MANIKYEPSRSIHIQGKFEEIYKKYGENYSIREQGGGYGNWIVTKKSDVLIDEISYRDFVLEYYGKSRLTENLYYRFKDDLENGKITLF